MSESVTETPVEEQLPTTPVEPEVVLPEPEISEEQKLVNEQVEAVKSFLEKQVDALYAEGFPMYVIDTASDIYKSWCKIKMGKTQEWDAFCKTREELEETFFKLKSNELTPNEKATV